MLERSRVIRRTLRFTGDGVRNRTGKRGDSTNSRITVGNLLRDNFISSRTKTLYTEFLHRLTEANLRFAPPEYWSPAPIGKSTLNDPHACGKTPIMIGQIAGERS
ncbi:hypothetical protein BCEN4_1040019 [Burkholderia cenocepacia]|nr:hypothetical protein BCEN4_1040019 [Burkholderia cenocepacia]